ncbi:PBECR2 nuclease fold domain-containing protein [Paracoccus amoyensis]|uniref:PBECR2 nuclease fold domain-containing protein n=1 Tax=Paracoccus amoyensis TaxID=2760093 RepID=UPI0031B5E729
MIGQVLELAGLEGREAVFVEMDGNTSSFAEGYEFAEQIEFLRQKRGKPTRAWTDAMQGDHDRAFVVAGVTDMAMLEEFQAAVIEGARTYDIKGFAAEFDRLVEKYGWSYKGGREWRIRTIFETNIRTSYMAGRLKQMRDPDVVKLRPYWQYRHAETRVPMNPRAQHVAWDRLVLMWDDPWWDVYFPPNDWICSCGVQSLSRPELRALGKTGPDLAPAIIRKPYTHRATGEIVQLPEGTGYGWDYQPGNLWERGLVPSALIDEADGLIQEGRHAVIIDEPSPLDELVAQARPFTAEPLPEGLPPEDYVRAFLQPFGADIDEAVLWQDPAGTRIPISDQFFRDRGGMWKVGKRGRDILTPLMAETLLDPDEIWLGVAAKNDPVRPDLQELLLDRRYIRVDPDQGVLSVMQIGRKWWEPVTIYLPQNRRGEPDIRGIQTRRGGKLVWKRK